MAELRAPHTFIRQIGLQGRLGVLFFAVMVATGLILAVIGYRMVVNATTSGVQVAIDNVTNMVKTEITHLLRRPVLSAIDRLSKSPLAGFQTLEDRLTYLPLMTAMLRDYPFWGSVFMAYKDGDFFAVHNLTLEKRRVLAAPHGSAFMVVHKTEQHGEHLFYDNRLKLLSRQRSHITRNFDPRAFEWFHDAMSSEDPITSAPYILTGSGQAGKTFVYRNPDGKAVAGVHISIAQLSSLLRRELPTPNAALALLRPDGTVIANARGMSIVTGDNIRLLTTEDLLPPMRLGVQAYNNGWRGRGIEIEADGRIWELSIEELNSGGKASDIMLLAIPQEELIADGVSFLWYSLLGGAGALFFCLPLTWLVARRIARPLRSLAASSGGMQELLSADTEKVMSTVPEIQALAESMQRIQEDFHKLMYITHILSSERDFELLMRDMLREILLLAKVDGSMLALLDDKEEGLLCEYNTYWLVNGEETARRYPVSEPLSDTRRAVYRALSENAVIRDTITRGDPRKLYQSLRPGFADPEVDSLDFITLPLRDRAGEKLGVLLLFKTVKPGENGFQAAEAAFVEVFAGAASIALENRRLLKAQKDVRDALIQILAGAIDAKSPYTGGHGQRVPVIFQMLLAAACDSGDGPFKDFTLDEDGWEEARLAGWLHDCGKVTTPEYVMDKATKLETLYDRIHEVRTRFEVLKRDAVIQHQRSVLEGADPEDSRRKMEEELRALDDDFAFVASCNAGCEYMDDTDLERLAAIGKRSWLRTLDKRLGVSRGERARMDAAGVTGLPVREPLLMDNPEHLIPRGEKDILPDDKLRGFNLSPPKALYNRGELHNLSIRRGTLTAEERYKINEHVIRTIFMLEAIPLPRNLRNVPEIAGSHHETINGKGYPRGLKREDMSWGARMMAVADIFEALTACDRPYRSCKTLSETLQIMDGMRENGQIDPDVYDLFLRTGIPYHYAEKYLLPARDAPPCQPG